MIQSMKPTSVVALLASSALFLTACDTFKEKVHLSGKRETVLSIDTTVTPDFEVEHSPIVVTPMHRNKEWSQAGGVPSHVMPNANLPKTLHQTWSTNIGSGVSEDHRLTSGPVMANDRVYASDAVGRVTAVNVKDGAILWTVDTLPEAHGSEAMGGGISYDNGVLYCATSFGELLALKASDGKILWRKPLGAPSRVAPTIKDGTVYALTINNETHAYTATTGNSLWSHSGISEAAGILGGASPAVADGIVVSVYSSGEIFAFNANTGQPIWGELLNPALRIDSVASIAHIRARPLISGGVVYIISHGGQMVALDLKSGNRLWQREIAGIRSPAIMGDSLFLVTNDGDLVCIKAATGKIHWAVSLPKVDDNKRIVLWAGPIIAGDALVLTGSNGQLHFASLKNGSMIKKLDMEEPASSSPIVADGALYVLTDNATLLKYSGAEKKS
ncbi:MAG: PQQ-binding-like beta-propeller repeat protein [Alphaproteobacteria bacterium]|jgi:outer membrane protein assembly factor BamB|nr:PQQ-binding-like beta-propeller repeat protein [Alphaproteobacteria bacterium]